MEYNNDSNEPVSANEEPTPKHKLPAVEVLIACGIGFLLIILLFCAWYLGKQRAVDEYQSTVIALQAENKQLSVTVDDLNEKLLISGPVSAEAAQEILMAQYPDNCKVVTLVYPFSDCARYAHRHTISDWEIPFTEKAYTVKWDGHINAGVNMADVAIQTNKAGDTLVVTIPNAEVFDFVIDEDSLQLLDEQNNLLNPISMEDLLSIGEEMKETVTARAMKNNILDIAQDNAMYLIINTLRSHPSIGSHYDIEIRLQ